MAFVNSRHLQKGLLLPELLMPLQRHPPRKPVHFFFQRVGPVEVGSVSVAHRNKGQGRGRMWETRRRTPFPYPAAPPKPPASKLGLPHIRLMLLSVTPFRGTSLCSCPTALRLFLAVTLLRQGFERQARSFGLSRRGFFLIRSKTEF